MKSTLCLVVTVPPTHSHSFPNFCKFCYESCFNINYFNKLKYKTELLLAPCIEKSVQKLYVDDGIINLLRTVEI